MLSTSHDDIADIDMEIFKELSDHDRCDRCNARAKCRAHKGSLELFFCGHHADDYFESLTDQGFYIYLPQED